MREKSFIRSIQIETNLESIDKTNFNCFLLLLFRMDFNYKDQWHFLVPNKTSVTVQS